MRLLIFILALTSAFFVPNSYSNETLPEDFRHPKGELWKEVYCHMTTSYTFKGINASLEMCIEVLQPQAEKKYGWQMSQPDAKCVGSLEGQSVKFECSHYNPNGNPPSAFYYGTAKIIGEEYVYSCPPDHAPEYDSVYPYSLSEPGFVCVKSSVLPDPDLDPDCPAPTDNDPFMFGTGQQQTICFNNPDGSQCSIQTDSNGGYYMPVSYGSQEPVTCNPTDPDPTDPDPTDPDPTDPDPTDPDPTDPDKTPDPDPSPEPDPTDNTDAPDVLPALNQINDNLHAINNNMNSGFQNNHERLDRVAKEIQISNELANQHVYESKAIKDAIIGANEQTLGILNDMKNGITSIGTAVDKTNTLIGEGNEKLSEISDGINSTYEEGTCIGDLCSLDISEQLDEFDKSFQDFVNDEKDQKPPREFESYFNRFDSYVSSAFSGFTGQCVPFDIQVSIRNVERVISVGEHCPYYEEYFKPVIEWFLYVLTFVSVLNITSQSFRAFSTI